MTAVPSSPIDAPTLALRQQHAQANPDDVTAQLEYGAALHEAGQPEHALVAFEKALTLSPTDVDAVSACATVLFELARPQAAYQVLCSIKEQLLTNADGAANLGIAAEACGLPAEAQACYARALELEPDHLRALNNMGLLAAAQGRFDVATAHARRCVALQPAEPVLWLNLADVLTASRDYAAALAVLQQAAERFGSATDLSLRQTVLLAFSADFEGAEAALSALGAQGPELLREYLAAGSTVAADALPKRSRAVVPSMRELFSQQAFHAMQHCDWRYQEPLLAVLRDLLAQVDRTGEVRDWRDAEFYGMALPLGETELARMRKITGSGIAVNLPAQAAPFKPARSLRRDDRLHIGLAVQSLRDPRVTNGLARRLALHDTSRFAFHIYAPTPRPEASLSESLRPFCEGGVVEIAHMDTEEATARIRLDNLDLFMDAAFYTLWCRPEVFTRRVAPVQLRELAWQRHHAPRNSEYTISDRFIHPDGLDLAPYGNIVRMPHSCWMAANDDQPAEAATRAANGLPEEALVLCAFTSAVIIDPHSFALWMQMLRALPAAVLWLPNFPPATRANLAREAVAAGVAADRLVFAGPGSRADSLARLRLADLFLDTVRCNSALGLADALRMGLPALGLAGDSLPSRVGAGMIRAAGLQDCVLPDPASYKDAVVSLGRNPAALKALRDRFSAATITAPLFDTAARVKEWESAWQTMIERHRAGLAPEAFDVPDMSGRT